MNNFNIGHKIQYLFDRLRGTDHKAKFAGSFEVEIVKADGRVIKLPLSHNGIVNAGLNSILNVQFQGATQITAWYIGLISNTSYTALAASDTMASHSGWTEDTNYSGSTRPQWSPSASTAQSSTNSSTVDFAMNPGSPVTIKGIFIASNNTKGGTSGTLWATGLFSGGDQSLSTGDTLKITYTVNASAS